MPEEKNYIKDTDFAAPTDGLQKVTFDCGTDMKPGEFKYNVEQLARFVAKKNIPTDAKSVNTGTEPNFQYPDNLKQFPIHQEL